MAFQSESILTTFGKIRKQQSVIFAPENMEDIIEDVVDGILAMVFVSGKASLSALGTQLSAI